MGRFTSRGSISIAETGQLQPATKPETPAAPRTRTRSKVSWPRRLGVTAAMTAALFAGAEGTGKTSSQLADTGTSSQSPTSLLTEASQTSGDRHISYSVQKVANTPHTEQVQIGNYGSTTDAVSKVVQKKIEQAGIQNPSQSDILQVTTAVGAETPEIQNLDIVQPNQAIHVPDSDSIKILIQANHGQSPDAELNAKAAALRTAIDTQGYNNARDEAAAMMTAVNKYAEKGTTGSVKQHQEESSAPVVPAPVSEPVTPSVTPAPMSEVTTQPATPAPVPPPSVPEEPALASNTSSESDNGMLPLAVILGALTGLGVSMAAGRRTLKDFREKRQKSAAAYERTQQQERKYKRYPFVDVPKQRRTKEEFNAEFSRARQIIMQDYYGGGTIFYSRDSGEIAEMLTKLGLKPDEVRSMVETAKKEMPELETLYDAESVYSIEYTSDWDNSAKKTFRVVPAAIRVPVDAAA